GRAAHLRRDPGRRRRRPPRDGGRLQPWARNARDRAERGCLHRIGRVALRRSRFVPRGGDRGGPWAGRDPPLTPEIEREKVEIAPVGGGAEGATLRIRYRIDRPGASQPRKAPPSQ